jgi:hypothetical protein
MTLTSAVDVGLIAMPDFLCERPSRRHRIAGAHLCRPEQQGKRSSIIQKIALGHWLTSECQEEKYAVAVCRLAGRRGIRNREIARCGPPRPRRWCLRCIQSFSSSRRGSRRVVSQTGSSEASGSDADAARPNSSERPDSGSVRPGRSRGEAARGD